MVGDRGGHRILLTWTLQETIHRIFAELRARGMVVIRPRNTAADKGRSFAGYETPKRRMLGARQAKPHSNCGARDFPCRGRRLILLMHDLVSTSRAPL